MKALNFFTALFLSIGLLSCGDDDSAPSFQLNEENVIGSYELSALSGDEESTVDVNGTSVVASETVIEGTTFDDPIIELSADGTYTSSGLYAFESTTTTGNETTSDDGIVNIEGEGTYELNIEDREITFTSTSGNVIDGEFSIERFTESSLVLLKEDVEVNEQITTVTNTTFTFEK